MPVVEPIKLPPCSTTDKNECVGKADCQWIGPACYLDKRGRKHCPGAAPGFGVCVERKVSSAQETPPNVPKSKPLPAPSTGLIGRGFRRNKIAPLTIETQAGTNYLIKLVNVGDAKDQIMIYVSGGQSYSTKVPLGFYHVRGASGDIWYGKEDLFGPDTRFFRLRTKNGKATGELQVLHFYRQGNKIMGMTLSFKAVRDGNMEQEVISRNDF
jgi:hypothetical protein